MGDGNIGFVFISTIIIITTTTTTNSMNVYNTIFHCYCFAKAVGLFVLLLPISLSPFSPSLSPVGRIGVNREHLSPIDLPAQP